MAATDSCGGAHVAHDTGGRSFELDGRFVGSQVAGMMTFFGKRIPREQLRNCWNDPPNGGFVHLDQLPD